jgi:hypothetical protein
LEKSEQTATITANHAVCEPRAAIRAAHPLRTSRCMTVSD